VKLTSIPRGCEYTGGGGGRYAEKHNKTLTIGIIREGSGGAAEKHNKTLTMGIIREGSGGAAEKHNKTLTMGIIREGSEGAAEKHNKTLTMSITREGSGGAVTYCHPHIPNKTTILAGNRTEITTHKICLTPDKDVIFYACNHTE
jgi:hypothetical protein